jgi:hypothetical protein
MADAIDAALEAPAQPSDAYLAAVSALLLAVATNTVVTDDEVDALCSAFDELPSGVQSGIDLGAALRCNLALLGLTHRGWAERLR